MFNFVKRAFYKPNWKLAIRESFKENDSEYNAYIPEANYWCADPFIIKDGDSTYIFCEYCPSDSNKGTIAVGEYKNGAIKKMRIIIEQCYHMSYPCVFKYDSAFYMIPETAQNKTIELYKAKRFPYEWELIKVLKENIRCFDSTVFMNDDELLVIASRLDGKKNKICIFKLDMEYKTVHLINETDDDGTGRPAGNIIFANNKLIRPAQVSTRKYGESISFKEITSLKSDYKEKTIFQMQGKDIIVKSEKKVDRIHTFNRISNVEIIDYSVDSFELSRPLKIIARKLKNLINVGV